MGAKSSPVGTLSTVILTFALAGASLPLGATEAIEPRTGAVTLAEVDLQLRAGAMSVNVERVYQSGESDPGLLGAGWRLTLEKRVVRTGGGVRIQESPGTVVFSQKAGGGTYAGPPGEQLTLEPDRTVRQRSDGASETYGVDGRLMEIRRPGGEAVSLEYDSAGHLARAAGPGGSSLRFITDPAGKLVRVDSSTGAAAAYRYAGDSLAEVQVNGGPVTRYSYDAQHRLVRIETAHTGARELAYDAKGRVIERKFADGAAERYVYDDMANSVRVTDPAGGVTSIQLSTDRREETITDAMGRRAVLRFDDAGRLLSATGPTGLSARFSYDVLGRMVSASGPGLESRFAYEGDTPLVAAIDYSDGLRQTFQYDVNRNLLALREGAETVSAFTYFPNGQMASLKQKMRPELRFTYGPEGRTQSMTEVGGRSWRLQYDRRGNLVRQTNAAGRMQEFLYDAQDRLVESTDAGATTKYAYDNRGRVAQVTDPAGRVTRYDYDVGGRLTARHEADGRATLYRYDAAGRVASITYPGGATYSYAYDAGGSLIRETNPLGGVTRYGYDALGQLASMTDATGRTWQYEYAAPGQVGKVIAPGGRVTEVQYDAQRRQSGVVDPAGLAVRLERDSAGRVTAAKYPGGVVRAVAYGSDGRLASASSNAGGSVKYEYDAAGRMARASASSGQEVSVEYNPAGEVARVRDNLGAALAYQYNPQGLVSALTDQAGMAVRIIYDPTGLPIQIVDPAGQAERFSYSPAGQLIELSETNGDTVKFEYDAAGTLAALHHPGGGVTRFVRDALANPVEVTNPLGAKTQFAYDVAGRLTGRVDADGRPSEYSYDEAGRLAQERLPDAHAVNYQYDPAGRLLSVDDGAFPVRYGYDAAGRRTRFEYPAIRKSMGYEYDSGGLLAKFTAPDGSQVRYGYDQHKRLNSMMLADGRAIRFGYDAKGRLTSMQYPNDITGAWEWDASGRLVRVSYRNAAKVEIDGCRYTYDNAGRPVRAIGVDGQAAEYRYDAAGQLIGESGGSGAIRYAYAPGGNRVRRETGGKAVAYKHNAADQVVQAGDEAIAYDRRGNMVERRGPAGVTRYSWDAENRLVRVQKADGSEVQYGYTAAGSRAWRKDKNGTTYFLTDGVNLLADVDEKSAASTTYIQAPGIDQPVAMIRGSQIYFYHTRALGTISSITDSTGKVAATYRTDAFGNLTASTGTVANRLLFTAREYEADLGLYYYRARYYDPGLGRFLSADPDSTTLTDPIEGNRYAYVGNAPVGFRDPLGTRIYSKPPEQFFFQERLREAPDLGFLAHPAPGTPFRSYSSEADYLQQEHGLTPEMVQQLRNAHTDLYGGKLEQFSNLKGQELVEAIKNKPQAEGANGSNSQLEKYLDKILERPPKAAEPQPNVNADEPPDPFEVFLKQVAAQEAAQAKMPTMMSPAQAAPRPPRAAPVPETIEPQARIAADLSAEEAQAAMPTVKTPAVRPPGESAVEPAPETETAGKAGAAAGLFLVAANEAVSYKEGDKSAGDCVKDGVRNVATGSALVRVAQGVGAVARAGIAAAEGTSVLEGAAAGAEFVAGVLSSPYVVVPLVAYGAYQLVKRIEDMPPPAPTSTEIFGRTADAPAQSGFQSAGSTETIVAPVSESTDAASNLWMNDVFQSEAAAAEAAAAMQAYTFAPVNNAPNQPQVSKVERVLSVLNAFMGVVGQMRGMQAATTRASSQSYMGFMQKVQQQLSKSTTPKAQQNAQQIGGVVDYYKQWQTANQSQGGPAPPSTIKDFQTYVSQQVATVTPTPSGTGTWTNKIAPQPNGTGTWINKVAPTSGTTGGTKPVKK